MAATRYDRKVISTIPTEDIKILQKRVNEALRQLSEMISKLEGRSGESVVKNSLTVKSDGYTLLDMESALAGKASFCGITGTTRTFEIAKGAKRDKDKQWIATDTGAVILQLKDDGTMVMYANTGLTIGAAFAPLVAITFPGGTATHGLVSATHTASGLTTGYLLTATGTNTFNFAAPTYPATKGARVYSTATQTLTSGTATVITFNGETLDTDGYHIGSGSALTVPSADLAGYYLVRANVRWSAATIPVGRRTLRLEKNSSSTPTANNIVGEVSHLADITANQATDQIVTAIVSLAQNDMMELIATHVQGTNLTIAPVTGAPDQWSPVFEMYLIAK